MVDKLIELSLRRPFLILTFAGLLTLLGFYAFRTIPIDAFPDVTSVLVQVVTKAPGLSPEEVERLVTFPIEQQITGIPHLTELRSLTKVGLSLITVVFDDQMDINLARQLVLERLIEVQEHLPPGSEPMMTPNSTGLGEVYQYYLEGPPHAGLNAAAVERELIEQRTVQDWVIRPFLKGTPGVIDVNSQGGFVKQFQVLVEPELLHKYSLSLDDVFTAVANNNANAAGNILETHAEKFIVRGVGLIRKLSDIEDIVVKEAGGTPVHIHDVAQVQIGHAIRHGAVVLNGEREVVAGIVLMLRGGNARDVVEGIKGKIAQIQDKGMLPAGWRIVPFYDRIELISAALKTVYKALAEGILLVVVVLFVFLGDTRSALIVAATLTVTPLVTFFVMDRFDLTANLMSLGGLAPLGSPPPGPAPIGAHPQCRSGSCPPRGLRNHHHHHRLYAHPLFRGHGRQNVQTDGLYHHDCPDGVAHSVGHPVAGSVFADIAARARRRSLGASTGQADLYSGAALGAWTSVGGTDGHRTHADGKHCALSFFGV
jgi:heavy metal efflux system protein